MYKHDAHFNTSSHVCTHSPIRRHARLPCSSLITFTRSKYSCTAAHAAENQNSPDRKKNDNEEAASSLERTEEKKTCTIPREIAWTTILFSQSKSNYLEITKQTGKHTKNCEHLMRPPKRQSIYSACICMYIHAPSLSYSGCCRNSRTRIQA